MSRKRVLLSATASLMGSAALAEVPNVAVDIAPVHSLVARVMEGVGTPELILPPGASPHEYNLRPSEAAALQDAAIVIWMGADLAPWMENAVETLASEATVLTLLEREETMLLDFREGAMFEAHDHDDHDDHGHDDHDDHGHDDHDDHDHDDHDDHGHDDHDDHDHDRHDDHGHDDHDDHDDHGHDDHDHDAHHDDEHAHAHGAHDPHAWLAPSNAAVWLDLIAAELSAADPDNGPAYLANAASARAELDTLVTEVNAILDPVRGGRFIGFHDAYQYFESDFDFPASGAISLSDASDPSPARIAEIQGRVRQEGIDCVLAEPQFNPGIVTAVLDGTEAKTAVIDPLGATLEPGPGLYPQLVRNMAGTLAGCLEPRS